MKKRSTKEQKRQDSDVLCRATRHEIRERAAKERLIIGLDLGDKYSSYCILSEQREILYESTLPTTQAGLGQVFEGMARCVIALEVGTHSPWVSRCLDKLGHEVIVANARNIAYITRSTKKNDRLDARKLAQLTLAGVDLLSPIRHRSETAQADLAILRARNLLVRQRTRTIISIRGMAKSLGHRLKPCAPEAAGVHLVEGAPQQIRNLGEPALKNVESLNEQIAAYDKLIEAMAKRYPETERLRKVYGVGQLIALAFLLVIDDARRFKQSRDVGPYVGFRPKQRDSGESQPELGISKEGDKLLRSLLVQAAQTILRKKGADSDIRRWGLAMLEEGIRQQQKQKSRRKGLKKKVVVAVARKLAVLLHRLWVSGDPYDPLYNSRKAAVAAKKVAA